MLAKNFLDPRLLGWYFRTIIKSGRVLLSSGYGPSIGLFDLAAYSQSFKKAILGERCLAMASSLDYLDSMVKPTTPRPPSRSTHAERRGSRRCKITQLMRIRPSDPQKDHFDDIRGSLSVSRTGVFFHSSEKTYEVGMRLFVTMPYTKESATMQREFLAEVVRRDQLPNGLYGIGFKILMEVGFQNEYSFGNYSQRK